MSYRLQLDHLVLATPDLLATVADFAARTGVQPAPGGRHASLATANHLVGLGDSAYLEIIGPDPDRPAPEQGRPFGIDTLSAPRLVTWAVACDDIDALTALASRSGYDPGPILPMSRTAPSGEVLEWRLTLPALEEGTGLVPFVIDWGQTPHPTDRGLPQVRLAEWFAVHPNPGEIHRRLDALGAQLDVRAGRHVALFAAVTTERGRVALG